MSESGVVPLAEIVRSGFTEGYHRGRLVALAPDGSVDFALGEADEVILPRSSNKPMQAVAMIEHGLGSTSELLALAAASHAGEPFHIEGVRKILAGAGLGEEALRCLKDWPLSEEAKLDAVRSGGAKSRVQMNCSGKLRTIIYNNKNTYNVCENFSLRLAKKGTRHD